MGVSGGVLRKAPFLVGTHFTGKSPGSSVTSTRLVVVRARAFAEMVKAIKIYEHGGPEVHIFSLSLSLALLD